MISAKEFIDLLAEKDLVPEELVVSLRKKIAEKGVNFKIETVRGAGYRLVPE